MPDLKTFEQLATGHWVGTALLIIACAVLVAGIIRLYRNNQALYDKIELLLKERVVALEHLLEERNENRRARS